MPITKWLTGTLAKGFIEKVEVERETENCVFSASGRRESKRTEYHVYHDSWEDAHKHLTELAERRLGNFRHLLAQAQSHAGNIKGLKKPAKS